MEDHHHHRHHLSVNLDTSDNRFPQWSIQETKEFLTIRAELDQTFMETKRNKILWEVLSSNMKEKGYNRSADQCKSKWKNLVTRYKGCQTIETETLRQQFPFYNELQAIFAGRIERMLWIETEGRAKRKAAVHLSSDEDDDQEEDNDGSDRKGSISKRRRKGGASGGGGGDNKGLKEILEGFVRKQMELEVQWRKGVEDREEERRRKEMEWRQGMEAVEREKFLMDRRWREREEERWIREEARAVKKDALVTALLNKFRHDQEI